MTPELNIAYKYLFFPKGEHPKLLFGDDLSKSITEITGANKVSQCLSKKNFQSSPSRSNISLNSNTEGRNSGNRSFLYGGRGQRETFKPNCQQKNRKKQSPIQFLAHTITKTAAVMVPRPLLYKRPKLRIRFQETS